MMKEIWKKVPGYEKYQISNFGKVRHIRTGRLKKFCIQQYDGPPYLTVQLQKNASVEPNFRKRNKPIRIHRLLLMAFVRMPEDGEIGCHKNGNSMDNRLENLYWGTRKDNAQDSIRHGTFKFIKPVYGESHPRAKFSNELIEKIRAEYTGKRGHQKALCEKYGIKQITMSAILTGKIRKNQAALEVLH